MSSSGFGFDELLGSGYARLIRAELIHAGFARAPS